MKDSLYSNRYPNRNLHDRYRTFEENFLEKRLVFGEGELADGAEAAEAEGAAPEGLDLDDPAQKELAKKGEGYLRDRLGPIGDSAIAGITILEVVPPDAADKDAVESVTFEYIGIEVTLGEEHENEDVAEFETAAVGYKNQFSGFKFQEGSYVDIKSKEASLVLDLGDKDPDKAKADSLTVDIDMEEGNITDINFDPSVTDDAFEAKKAEFIGQPLTEFTADEIDGLVGLHSAAVEGDVDAALADAEATSPELSEEAKARIASFKGDEISQNDLLAPRGLSKMKAGDEVKYILKDGDEIAQVTITRTEEGYTATILDGRTGETGEISMGKDGGHFEMYGRRTEIKEDEDKHNVMTAQTTDGSVRTFHIKDDGMVEIVGDEEMPVEDPKALYKTMFSEEGLPPREADSGTEAPKEEKEDPAGTKEVTLQDLRDMKDSLSTDGLKDLVGTTFKLKDAALTTYFTVQEGEKGPQILVRMSGGNEYVIEELGGEEGLSFIDQHGTKVDLLPGRHGVDIRVEGKWNGEDIKGKFKVNKEGDTMFKGKVSGKPFGGKVDLDRGTIDPNPRLFRSKEKTKELKDTFEGFLGTLQDFIAELMVMLEETGILDMFNMSLNKGNDPNKRASLFVLRNKLGTKNTGKLKTVKASKVMEAPADSTAQTMANLRGLGFDPSGTQGSGLMKVIAKVAEIQDEKKDDPQFDMGANESLFDYVSRTKMIDKNGFWSAEYQSYDPEADATSAPGSAPAPTEKAPEKKMDPLEQAQERVRQSLRPLDPEKETKEMAKQIVKDEGFRHEFDDGTILDLPLTEADGPAFKALLLTPIKTFEGKPFEEAEILAGLPPEKKDGVVQFLKFLHSPDGKHEGDSTMMDTYNIADIAKKEGFDGDKITVADFMIARYGDDLLPTSEE